MMAKGSEMKNRTQVDQLFENFLRELDEFSHNGVLRKMQFPRVWELMDHWIDQCSTVEAERELEERIRLFVDSRVKYSIAESDLVISLKVEDSVRLRIQKIFKEKNRPCFQICRSGHSVGRTQTHSILPVHH